jgi:hypothetical protein
VNARLKISASQRNLSHRPAKPAKGRGRLQVAARRAFYEAEVVTTAEVAQAAYARAARATAETENGQSP